MSWKFWENTTVNTTTFCWLHNRTKYTTKNSAQYTATINHVSGSQIIMSEKYKYSWTYENITCTFNSHQGIKSIRIDVHVPQRLWRLCLATFEVNSKQFLVHTIFERHILISEISYITLVGDTEAKEFHLVAHIQNGRSGIKSAPNVLILINYCQLLICIKSFTFLSPPLSEKGLCWRATNQNYFSDISEYIFIGLWTYLFHLRIIIFDHATVRILHKGNLLLTVFS